MSDMQALVSEVTQELEDAGFLKAAIRKAMEKSMTDVAENLFRSYGSFGKALEKKMEEELILNLDKLSVASYGDVLLTQVRGAIDETVLASAGIKITKLVGKYLTKLDKQNWKLSEIIQQWKESVGSYRSSDNEQIGFDCDESEYQPGHYYIGFDKDSHGTSSYGSKSMKSRYQMENQLTIRPDGTLADFKVKGKTPQQLVGGEGVHAYGFDAFLLSLYANQVVIEVDNDEVILDWNPDEN